MTTVPHELSWHSASAQPFHTSSSGVDAGVPPSRRRQDLQLFLRCCLPNDSRAHSGFYHTKPSASSGPSQPSSGTDAWVATQLAVRPASGSAMTPTSCEDSSASAGASHTEPKQMPPQAHTLSIPCLGSEVRSFSLFLYLYLLCAFCSLIRNAPATGEVHRQDVLSSMSLSTPVLSTCP